MKLTWTKPYYGITHVLSPLPKGHYIMVAGLDDKVAEATWLNHNVGGWSEPAGKMFGTVEKCKKQAIKWANALLP